MDLIAFTKKNMYIKKNMYFKNKTNALGNVIEPRILNTTQKLI